jgi:hypothetical protein
MRQRISRAGLTLTAALMILPEFFTAAPLFARGARDRQAGALSPARSAPVASKLRYREHIGGGVNHLRDLDPSQRQIFAGTLG